MPKTSAAAPSEYNIRDAALRAYLAQRLLGLFGRCALQAGGVAAPVRAASGSPLGRPSVSSVGQWD